RSATPAAEVHTRQLTPARKIAIVAVMTAIAVGAGGPLAYVLEFDRDPALNPIGLASTLVEAVMLLFSIQILLYGVVRTYVIRPKSSLLVCGGAPKVWPNDAG